MLSHALLLFLLISFGIYFSVSHQKHFEETFPVTCMGIVILLYICGLLGALKLGVYLVVTLSLCSYLASIFLLIRNKQWRTFCHSFFTPGFCIFVLMYLALTVLNHGRVASSWDEFSHWVDVTKAMFVIDDFSTSPLSNSAFQSYPPAMALFQYFVQKLCQFFEPNAIFSEWRVYFAYQIFASSFFLPFLKSISFKKIFSCLLCFGTIFLSPMVLFRYLYPIYAYIDPFVAIVAGCGFATAYVTPSKHKDLFIYSNLLMSLAILVLAKDVGLMYALFLGSAIVLEKIISIKKTNHEEHSTDVLKLCLLVICTLAFIFLPKISWNASIAANNASKSFSKPIIFSALLDVILGKDTSYRTEVLTQYTNKFLTGTQSIGKFNLALSWPVIFLVFFIGLLGIHLGYKKIDSQNHRSRTAILIILIVQTCIYIVGLCVLYMFKFSEYEAVRLASFDRYLGITFSTLLIALILVVFSFMQKHRVLWYPLCLLLLSFMLVLLPTSQVRSYLNRSSVNRSIATRVHYEPISTHLLNTVEYQQKKVYIVSQENNGLDYWILRYSIRPCVVNAAFTWSLSTQGSLYEGDIWTVKRSAEQWQKELETYDYVLIYKTNQTFIDDYAKLFATPNDIKDNTLFSVDHETGLLISCN